MFACSFFTIYHKIWPQTSFLKSYALAHATITLCFTMGRSTFWRIILSFFVVTIVTIWKICLVHVGYLKVNFAISSIVTYVTVILWNLNLYQYILAFRIILNLLFLFRRGCLSSSGRQYAFRTIQSFRKRISQWNIFLGSLLWLQVWFSMKPTQTKKLGICKEWTLFQWKVLPSWVIGLF